MHRVLRKRVKRVRHGLWAVGCGLQGQPHEGEGTGGCTPVPHTDDAKRVPVIITAYISVGHIL